MKLAISLFSAIFLTNLVAQNNSVPDIGRSPAQAWVFQTGGPVMGSPVVDGNLVYAGSADGTLYALDKENGTVKWRFPTSGAIRSAVCADKDKIFVFSGNGNLYAVFKTTGKSAWRFQTAAGALGDRTYDFADYYHASPVVYRDKVFFGAGDGRVYALRCSDGALVWQYETGDIVHTTPAIARDKLFIGSFDGKMYALQAETGAPVWTFKTTGHRYFPRGEATGNPVVMDNLLYFGARDYNFYALDLNGGYCHWHKQFPRGWALPATPGDSVLYLGTSDDRQLLAVDPATGQTHWKTDAGFNIFGGLALSGSMGYFGTLAGKVFGIDLKSGAVRWTFITEAYKTGHLKYMKENGDYRDDIGELLPEPPDVLNMYRDMGGVFSTPALSGDRIFFTTYDGKVYCLKG